MLSGYPERVMGQEREESTTCGARDGGTLRPMKHESANLDLLRSVAVSIVVISHIPRYLWPWPQAYSLQTLGRLGVAIFFVHTTLVLLQSMDRHGDGVGGFYVRRFFRIYPLSIAVVLFTSGMLVIGGRAPDVSVFVSNLLLVQNLTGAPSYPHPLWSLPFEVQMYLVLPVIYAITRYSARPVAGIVALALVAAAASLSGIELVQYVPCFLAGALCFVLTKRLPAAHSPALLAAVVCIGAALVPALVAANPAEKSQVWAETLLFWPFCLAIGLVIPRCREVRRAGLARIGKTVATYSYGVYLTHIFVIAAAFPGPQADGAHSWIILAVLLPLFSWIVHHAVERPGMRLGARIADRMVKPAAVRSRGMPRTAA
jgi:peptidoglycan/LPS O-acetylase OafA/YrhL